MPTYLINQLTVMCTTRSERTLSSIRYQKECVESNMDGQTDSHSNYSAHLRVVPSLNIFVVIDNCDLHILFFFFFFFFFFQVNIDFMFSAVLYVSYTSC